MPTRKTSNPNNGPSFSAPRYRPNWISAVICFVLGSWLTVALIDYSPIQSTFATTQTVGANLAGPWGANSVWILFYAIGASTWLLPIFLGWLLYISIRNSRRLAATRLVAMLLCIVTLAGIVAMLESFQPSDYYPQGPGGWLGTLIYQGGLRNTMGVFGAALLLGTLYLCGLLFIFTRDIGAEIERYIAAFQAWRDERAKRKAERLEAKRIAKEARIKEKAELKAAAKAAKIAAKEEAKALKAKPKPMVVPETKEDPLTKAPSRPAAPTPAPEPVKEEAPPAPVIRFGGRKKASPEPAPVAEDGKPLALNIVKAEETKKARVSIPQSDDANYIFPDIKLLVEEVTNTEGNSEEEHRQNAENLLRILEEFGVKVTLGEIHVGPVITRYEVVPAAGVRVEKISGLDKNIALGMRAQSVRILAPIPGKAAVGVEVPNKHPIPVGMREILESEDWVKSKAELPIALGKDVSGKPLISDLTKMPHLLIAGATGSGKSVCINSIVASILYSKSPRDVRMLMVDPKVVELKIFNTLPQMLIPVVTEPKKVPGALKWLLGEMEQRYQMFAKCNVRNILGFNSRSKNAKPDEFEAAQAMLSGVDPAADDGIELPERLPYIVAIIDELADLMMVAPAEIESSIARLAQLARAAGIHLIIATQRPSVNVITGVIKANLPSRIAFQVASQVDSRTILDGKGADTLIGRGDMLFSPPGSSRLIRAQGAFVSDEEIIGLVEALKVNGPPQYAASVQQQIDRAASEGDDKSGGGGDDDDLGEDAELFEKALDVLRSTKRASTSMIQRRLRIGYNRAARIMDMLEDRDIVGPENGSSPREILVDLDNYQSD